MDRGRDGILEIILNGMRIGISPCLGYGMGMGSNLFFLGWEGEGGDPSQIHPVANPKELML